MIMFCLNYQLVHHTTCHQRGYMRKVMTSNLISGLWAVYCMRYVMMMSSICVCVSQGVCDGDIINMCVCDRGYVMMMSSICVCVT